MAETSQKPDHPLQDGYSIATLAVWAGEDDSLVQGPTQMPVVYTWRG